MMPEDCIWVEMKDPSTITLHPDKYFILSEQEVMGVPASTQEIM
jgi:hypothetical protein